MSEREALAVDLLEWSRTLPIHGLTFEEWQERVSEEKLRNPELEAVAC